MGRAKASGVSLATIALLAIVGWVYLLAWPMPMPDDSGVRTLSYAAHTVIMWTLMMIAMMAPAVTPVVLIFDRVNRQGGAISRGRTPSFIAGYLTAWFAVSVLASMLQILLIETGWVDTMGSIRTRTLTAALLIGVGIYQWLPIKASCLTHCRSPVQFLTQHYRRGRAGAWFMGLRHGWFCVGCCWALMLLLFAGGVMNLLWILALTAIVSIEKMLPRPVMVAHAVGTIAIAAGIALYFKA